jgi:hypothetical protein
LDRASFAGARFFMLLKHDEGCPTAGPGLGWTRHACMSRQRALQAFFSLAFGALADRQTRDFVEIAVDGDAA